MAKKSVWVWVGVGAGVLFLLLGLCLCSFFGYVYYRGQKVAEARKFAERAVPLIADADETLSSVSNMSDMLPSQRSSANAMVAAAADLPGAKEKLSSAKGYLDQAAAVGASGDVGKFIDAKLASTNAKMDIIELRTQQAEQLAAATKAATAADAAKPPLDQAFKLINRTADFRNQGNYSGAAKYLQTGNALLTRSLRLYRSAEAAYKKADFSLCISAIAKARVAVRYKKQLDSLGLANNTERYNVVRNNSNSAWDSAFGIWKRTGGKDNSRVVDTVYAPAVSDLVTRIGEKTSEAQQKDSQAGSLK